MVAPVKPFVVGLVASITFAFGAAPAFAETVETQAPAAASAPVSTLTTQTLNTEQSAAPIEQINSVLAMSEASQAPHGFDVEATIAAAEAEIGSSRPTGWSQPGECIMSAQRWIRAGGGAWTGGGDPVSNYRNATRLTIEDAQPGDIVQYEYISSPTSWVTGVHTVLITGVNDDGTFQIIESNNPFGSGYVQSDKNWLPKPPSGFQAVVWRF